MSLSAWRRSLHKRMFRQPPRDTLLLRVHDIRLRTNAVRGNSELLSGFQPSDQLQGSEESGVLEFEGSLGKRHNYTPIRLALILKSDSRDCFSTMTS